MTKRELDRIVDPATCACGSDAGTVHSSLGEQIIESGVDIARPCLLYDLLLFGEWNLVVSLPTTLAKSAIVHRHCVKPARCKLLPEIRPGFAIAVAHVQQHDAWPGLRGRKVRCLEHSAVRSPQIDIAALPLSPVHCDGQNTQGQQGSFSHSR